MRTLRRRLRSLGSHVRHTVARQALARAATALEQTPILLEYPPNAANVPRYTAPHAVLAAKIGGAERYRNALGIIERYADDLARIPIRAENDVEPSWSNDFLPWLDSAALYAFLRDRNPARYVEIGSGNSTKFAARARTDGELRSQFTSIDPDPRAEIDTLCDRVIRLPLERADLSVFADLAAGDIVFMDGSHRVFMNNEVVVFFLEVLPSLPPGVLVGIHDIYLPFDYPADIAERYYSEQYMLAAYLLGEPPVSIVLPAWWTFSELEPEVRAIYDRVAGSAAVVPSGGAFWMQTLG